MLLNRILIYCHYNSYGYLSSHVIYTIKQVRGIFARIIFVSNSPVQKEDIKILNSLVDKIIQRENKGFDFGAWKDAIAAEGWNSLEKYDSLTLMNDTCFGPLFDMNKVYSKMESANYDFWGITNHKKSFYGMPGKVHKPIPEHLQSYFLCFNRKVVLSPVFRRFWEGLRYYSNINHVIQNYETQLTSILNQAGFLGNAYIDTHDYRLNSVNLAHCHPDVLIKNGSPFVKIKSFIYFDHPQYLKQLISRVSNYDIQLIDDHLYQVFSPNESIRMINRSLHCYCPKEQPLESVLKIAIHIHVYYIDVFMKYIEALDKVKNSFDLYLSTDTEEKRKEILTLSKEKNIENSIKNIVVCKNQGRDVAPWLIDFKEINEAYDIVVHFHTKKTAWTHEWIGESWQDEIIESLIINTDYIINYFQKHKSIGIIIPDISYYHSYVSQGDAWVSNRGLFNQLWVKMNLSRKLDAHLLDYPIMPYGNMFWYRPKALKPLFDLNLLLEDFPEEPIPADGTIAHAIERLPVYIAWSQGYDYRVAINTQRIENGFTIKEIKKMFFRDGFNSRKSRYEQRAGKIIMWIPYRFYKGLKKLFKDS